jgi:TolB protein
MAALIRFLIAPLFIGWLLMIGVLQLRILLPASLLVAYNVWQDDGLDIFLLDIERGLSANLTGNRVFAGRPMWSPDGRYLAFEGRYRGGSAVYIMDSFGADLRLLNPETAGNQFTPVWFRDGSGLFFRNVPGDDALAYQVRVDGSDLQPIHLPYYDLLAQPRIDPTRRVNLRQVIQHTSIQYTEPPQWSPDDRQIAFVTLDPNHSEIYLMNADGSEFRQVTSDGLFKGNLSWQP